jgi:hypothetical protein
MEMKILKILISLAVVSVTLSCAPTQPMEKGKPTEVKKAKKIPHKTSTVEPKRWPIAEELTPAKAADIRELLKVTGSADIGVQMLEVLTQTMANDWRALRPDIPHRFLEILFEEANILLEKGLREPHGFMDRIIGVYHKYYTHNEIKGLLEFYKTELGKKTVRVTPKVMNESMMIGQQWGQVLAPKLMENVQRRCKEEGIEIPKL